MVNNSPASLTHTFSALADPTRRAIVQLLARGEASVGELAKPFAISPPAISKHLRVLEQAGLIARRKEGRVHVISLEAAPIQEAADWLAHYRRYWEGQFDALADHLDQMDEA